MNRFEGKTAFVTGSGSGIGKATVELLVAEGATVVGMDLNPGSETDSYIPVEGDVTKEADLEAAIGVAVEKFGGLDLAFNVAGASKAAPIVQMSEEDWDFTVDLCLKGIFFSTKHEALAMKNGGAIVNVASLNAHVPMWFGSAYASAKAGVEMFSKNAALEFADMNIRVNTVLPGLTATPLTQSFADNKELSADFERAILMSRPGTPEEIAKPCLFLASEDASYVNGTSLVVDGGWEITGYPDLSKFM